VFVAITGVSQANASIFTMAKASISDGKTKIDAF
jgi:hypothetical protein